MDDFRRRHSPSRGRQVPTGSDAPEGAFGSNIGTGRDLAATPQTADPITVALIEDNRLVREALTTFLDRSPDIQVISGDPEGHHSILRELDPEVVLVDLGLENGDSLRLARQVLRDFPDARVIVMDLPPGCEELADLVAAGVSGFLMKDASLEDVLGTVRAVAAGLKVLPDQVTGTLFSEIARESTTNGRSHDHESVRMTPREREVIDLITEGKSNKAIAETLHISIHTVKTHLRSIMDKLSVHSRLEVAKHAYEQASRAQIPAPDRPPKGATPLAGPTTTPLIEQTVSRTDNDGPGRQSRLGAGRRGFGPRGHSRRRSQPCT